MLETYRSAVLDGMQRLLSRLDRRPWSPTFGCFDREYWLYKTLLDFPRPTMQQCVLALAVLHESPFPGNGLAGQRAVLDWIQAAVAFWARTRNGDGSVNEWYAHERSFCATAFTAYAMSETLLLLGTAAEASWQRDMCTRLEDTTAWLMAQRNLLVANQMAASLVAINNMYRLTHSATYTAAYATRKAELLAMQHAEGWFTEYEGADLGYSLLTVDLLAHLWHTTHDQDIAAALERLLAFLGYFVHPDGTVGGEYGSRATTHCFPYGLELLAAAGWPQARWMLVHIRQAIEQGRVPSPLTVDDTYAAYFYLNSFCQAACASQPLCAPEHAETMRNRFFPGAGLLVRENAAYYAVVSTRLAGVWRAYDHTHGLAGDSGYVAVTVRGQRLSSQRLESDTACTVQGVEAPRCTLEIETRFGTVDTSLPLVKHIVAFKLFTRWLLRLPWLALLFSRLLKQRKILGVQAAGLHLRRVFRFDTQSLRVEDTLRLVPPLTLQSLHKTCAGTVVHSPSSQMYSVAALHSPTAEDWDAVGTAQRLMQDRHLSVHTQRDF
jgi:hypothetical protein